jgi:hypothetical protein
MIMRGGGRNLQFFSSILLALVVLLQLFGLFNFFPGPPDETTTIRSQTYEGRPGMPGASAPIQLAQNNIGRVKNATIEFDALVVDDVFDNLFQTANSDEIRIELQSPRQAYLVLGDRLYLLNDSIELGRWYHFKISLQPHEFIRVDIDGRRVFLVDEKSVVDLGYRFDRIIVGSGFSGTRPLQGSVKDFSLNVRHSPYRLSYEFLHGLVTALLILIIIIIWPTIIRFAETQAVVYPLMDKSRLQILCLVSSLCAFGTIAFYMAQWLQMPLYPDEVALRISNARSLADGALQYSLLPQCLSNAKTIPLIFRPVAYLFSIFDFYFNWSLVRTVPLAGLLIALGASVILICGRQTPAALLITTAGLIGVAGAGLIIFRMELPLIFYGAACMVGYALVRRDYVRPALVAAYLAVSTPLALFALFVHVQGLILVPLGILLAAGFMIRQGSGPVRIFAGVSLACIAIGALVISTTPLVKCPEHPNVKPFFDVMTLPGLAKHEGLAGVENYIAGKLGKYTDQFLFKPNYNESYLPGVLMDSDRKQIFFEIFNLAISQAVLLNLLIACGVFFYTGMLTARLLMSGTRSFRNRLNLATTSPFVYLFFATAGHLGLFVVDIPTNFYRAFYIHFALVLVNALALTGLKGTVKVGLWPIGVVSLSLCILSGAVVRNEITPKFVVGWSGSPSIPVNLSWSAVRLEVKGLAAKCGIPANEPRIIVDDMTFDAMKQHPHLMPLTYIGTAYDPNAPGEKKEPEFIRSFGATYVLARCTIIALYRINPDASSGELCCAKL